MWRDISEPLSIDVLLVPSDPGVTEIQCRGEKLRHRRRWICFVEHRYGIYGFYIPDVRYRCGLYFRQEEKNYAAVGE